MDQLLEIVKREIMMEWLATAIFALAVALVGATYSDPYLAPTLTSSSLDYTYKDYPSILGSKVYDSDDYLDNIEANDLVTMRPKQLLEIIDCAKEDERICLQFSKCESLGADTPVADAVVKCQEMQIPHRKTKCYYREPEFQEPESGLELFHCVAASTPKLTPEQKRLIVSFEDCAKDLLKHQCHRAPSYYPSHYYDRYKKATTILRNLHL